MNKKRVCQLLPWVVKSPILILVTLLTCQAYSITLAEEHSDDSSTNRQIDITILQHTLVITKIENGLMTVMELIQAKNQGTAMKQQGNQPIILCSLPKEYLNFKLEPQSAGKIDYDNHVKTKYFTFNY